MAVLIAGSDGNRVPAKVRVRLANVNIFMFGFGAYPVNAWYQILPVFSQLFPPMAVAALQKARFGMPLLSWGSMPFLYCENAVGCGARQCAAAGFAMSRRQVNPRANAPGPMISFPISQ